MAHFRETLLDFVGGGFFGSTDSHTYVEMPR